MDIEGNSNQDLKTLINLDDRLKNLIEQILTASEELKELESLKQEQDEEIDRLKLERDNQQLMKENVEFEPEDEISSKFEFIGEFSDSERAKLTKYINQNIVKIFYEFSWEEEKIVIETKLSRVGKENVALRCPACTLPVTITEKRHWKLTSQNFISHVKTHQLKCKRKTIKPLQRSEHYEVNPNRESSLEDITKVNINFLYFLNTLGWNEDTSHIRFKDITTEQCKRPTIEVSCPYKSCEMKIELKLYHITQFVSSNMQDLKAHLNKNHSTDHSFESDQRS
jgi:hypothetical protein